MTFTTGVEEGQFVFCWPCSNIGVGWRDLESARLKDNWVRCPASLLTRQMLAEKYCSDLAKSRGTKIEKHQNFQHAKYSSGFLGVA